jgi:hypothetical protein
MIITKGAMITVQSQASIAGEASTSQVERPPLNIKSNRRRNTSHYQYDDNDADGQVCVYSHTHSTNVQFVKVRCRLSESVCTDMTSLLSDGHDSIGGCVPMTAVAFDNILQVIFVYNHFILINHILQPSDTPMLSSPIPQDEAASWRPVKDRVKTVCVGLVLCCNLGVDPPDIQKVSTTTTK